MTSKIEFYREVLRDDPNSRVFFPLARLLAEHGDADGAVAVLEAAMPMHPGHMEARFLLVELLTRLGRDPEASRHFEALSPLLSNYPGVWKLWAAKAPGLSRDAALALRFLALAMQGQDVSLLGIMEKGLFATGGATLAVSEASSSPQDAEDAFSLRGADEVMALTRRIAEEQSTLPSDELPPECASQQNASVKTRTMADLLAKHGDVASALEIYDNLLDMAGTDQEKAALRLRIEELTAQLSSGNAQKPASGQPKSNAKLVSMLEALANRLDARATA